jgi:L-lactate dehydrogenase complex protein LldF
VPGDPDGPEEYHVILLDNGRSAMLGTEFQDMLRCIRCGACMNHCPVYHAVGGHAYGWVYPGPMGAVLTPSLIGVDKGGHLPNASTFCGRCESVCPMRIPLPKMMRHWREREFERGLNPATTRYGLGMWAWFAKRPSLYRLAASFGIPLMKLAALGKDRFSWLPFAGAWTKYRDMPAPEGELSCSNGETGTPSPSRSRHERTRSNHGQGARVDRRRARRRRTPNGSRGTYR